MRSLNRRKLRGRFFKKRHRIDKASDYSGRRKKRDNRQLSQWLEAFGNAMALHQHIFSACYSRDQDSETSCINDLSREEIIQLLGNCGLALGLLIGGNFPDLAVVEFVKIQLRQLQAVLEMELCGIKYKSQLH